MEGRTETKYRAETDGKAIQKLPPMGIHPIYSHQTQTLFLDANKCLLTGAWYSCLLWSSTSAWQIKRWILSANHWTEHRVTNRGTRVRTHGAKGVCSPIGLWICVYCLSGIPFLEFSLSSENFTESSLVSIVLVLAESKPDKSRVEEYWGHFFFSEENYLEK